MPSIDPTYAPSDPLPLPENIRSVQPGSGFCYRVELAWGKLRRAYLKTIRPKYVKKMAALREGSTEGAPHEVLDPRDLKFCRNQCTARWKPEHDRFAWREKIPLARWGLCETILMAGPFAIIAFFCVALLPGPWKWLAIIPGILCGYFLSFFRDPPRKIPQEKGLLISPADGKVVDITEIEHDEFLGGPAVRIGIFLSIFNVHINRTPESCRVIELRYKPGEFLDARHPECKERNESMWIGLEMLESPYRRMIVRQVSGLLARRIVCDLVPGEVLVRGFAFGMIKLGSRTELILPRWEGLKVLAQIGDTVAAGESILAQNLDS